MPSRFRISAGNTIDGTESCHGHWDRLIAFLNSRVPTQAVRRPPTASRGSRAQCRVRYGREVALRPVAWSIADRDGGGLSSAARSARPACEAHPVAEQRAYAPFVTARSGRASRFTSPIATRRVRPRRSRGRLEGPIAVTEQHAHVAVTFAAARSAARLHSHRRCDGWAIACGEVHGRLADPSTVAEQHAHLPRRYPPAPRGGAYAERFLARGG